MAQSTAQKIPPREVDQDEPQKYKETLTSRVSAKKDGGREIYVYLSPHDTLDFQDGGAHLEVKVNAEGHRRWAVSLGEADVLETGRLDPPPPPPPPPGGNFETVSDSLRSVSTGETVPFPSGQGSTD